MNIEDIKIKDVKLLIVAAREFQVYAFKRIHGPGVTMEDRRLPSFIKVSDALDKAIDILERNIREEA